MDFICNRMFQSPHLIPLEASIRGIFDRLCDLPRFMIPKYFSRVIRVLHSVSKEFIFSKMSKQIRDGDPLIRTLAYCTLPFYSTSADAPLVKPKYQPLFRSIVSHMDASLSAGLPHFTTGWARSWGRDTMISLRGIFLIPGRFQEARDHLIVFGSCLRHGLIPNLQNGCENPRYNSRDAAWFYLQALQDYCYQSPEHTDILKQQIPHLFPTDDQREYYRKYQDIKNIPFITIADIVQNILESHANEIHFVEWDAGPQIDEQMKSEGFHIDIITDWTNGFILGGNSSNCGTWMDKMGSSAKAQNKGIPATSRDGADVEIIGLLASALRWLSEIYEAGQYPYGGVTIKSTGKFVDWKTWHNLLVNSFESWFYIPSNPEHDSSYFIEKNLVNHRGIYKDTVGCSSAYADYQFRPNILVAMTVAPELFDPFHAVMCLDEVEKHLMGHIGMKTLDESDSRYRPYYNNDDDSTDFLVSCGFNYHNGPEWVWPTGYFFRASMRFRRGITDKMKQMLSNIRRELNENPASGLPELTNKDGQVCRFTCDTQAWSIATIMEMLYDYSQYSEEDVIHWDKEEYDDIDTSSEK